MNVLKLGYGLVGQISVNEEVDNSDLSVTFS